ncbi:MAG: PRC-barrel domain containing protein [Chloroflexi bacterium]|nr:PRC-barrel domain containing protein [Chloroflexota bacterium]
MPAPKPGYRTAERRRRRDSERPDQRQHRDITWTTGKLIGYVVQGTDGTIGHVKDFFFEDQRWTIQYMIVDTGPWLLGRQVLLATAVLGRPIRDERRITVSLTKQQIQNSPDIDLRRPVSRQHMLDLHSYYGWPLPIYWGNMVIPGQPIMGVYPASPPPNIPPKHRTRNQGADPHLQSIREVEGYHVHAADGRVGHVDDFYIDEERWAIRYLLVHTRDWLPAKRVLIAPEWIERIRWAESEVQTRLTKEEIRTSPAHDPALPITHQDELDLYKHYGQLPSQ